MEITTVKIQKRTKNELDAFKAERESYDEVISKMISALKQKDLKKRLIEAYKSMGKNELELLQEWEPASQEV